MSGGRVFLARCLLGLAMGAVACCASAAEDAAGTTLGGTIRVYGSGLKGLSDAWIAGFRKHHPKLKVAMNEAGSDAVAGALHHTAADVTISGRELTFNEYLGSGINQEVLPTEITVASGGYDVPGSSFGLVVFVNAANPLKGLTLQQLDGVFGSPRSGGYDRLTFVPHQRTKAQDIREWGQLGLGGEWKKAPIRTHGYAYGGMGQFFQNQVFAGGDKWAESFMQYVENGTRLHVGGPAGAHTGILHMFKVIGEDRHAIGFAGMPQWVAAGRPANARPLALSFGPGQPFVLPSEATMRDRTYPLTRSVYIYVNQLPGQSLDPRVAAFIEYVLSDEGQSKVAENGIYFPLPRSMRREELKKNR